MAVAANGPQGERRSLDRRNARERRQEAGAAEPLGPMVPAETHRTVVENLHVHQIELEMQNEELSRAQLELESSRETYFDLYHLAPVGYLTLSEHSLILELNLTAAALVGCERAQLLDQPFTQLIHPEDQGLYYQKRRRLFEQGAPQAFELRLLRPSGAAVWVSVQATLARDRAGALVWRATLSDISERRQAEAALFQSQKLESLGILAGGMAHDFNNLLSAMLGNLELSDVDPAEGARERHLAVLRECVLRGAALCRQMLAYAGKAQFIREPIRLDYLVQGHLGFMQLSVAKGMAIELDLEPEPPEIEGDPAQIEQALLNLVVNASEASAPEGGTLRIRVGRRRLAAADLPALVAGAQLEPGPCVVLEVEDSGSGMDPATLGKIFDPFFSTRFIGRGLGLAALHGIMRVNGGAVQVRSRPGQGSCFTLWFPAAQPAPPPEAAPAREEGALRGSGTILVVDDDPLVRSVLVSFLRIMGFTVLEAEQGEEGVAVFRQPGNAIALVFMDLTMPRMGGLEAVRRIREAAPDARIILMSGYVQDSLAGAPEAEGICGFLKKPFLRSELEALLAPWLNPDRTFKAWASPSGR